MRVPLAVLAGIVAGTAGGLAVPRVGGEPPPCPAQAGFDRGSIGGDGVFLAYVSRGCGDVAGKTCVVADATKRIVAEHVDAGIAQDCVAFNQYIGAGLNAIPGYLTGECFGVAVVEGPGVGRRTDHPANRCDARR